MPATLSVPLFSSAPPARPRPRTALLASADPSFRRRLNATLTGLRWQVREAETGAQAWAEAETSVPEAAVIDSWLPDLDKAEFLRDFCLAYPGVDVIDAEGAASSDGPRSPNRQEIFYALRTSEDTDTASWNAAPDLSDRKSASDPKKTPLGVRALSDKPVAQVPEPPGEIPGGPVLVAPAPLKRESASLAHLPELVGNAESMLDVSRRILLVAPRSTPVLIEGPTGSGKEIVAEAVHRLSTRSRKPFIAINCAAIPEALLEAELFGHTRGAFTGAVQGRMGRIEAADGGTLFLDEIGEMPLALQSKLLRFVECGELQRVGDNETLKVNVRLVAATHRQLAKCTRDGTFRSDLYYRLAVFLIPTPALIDHMEDLPLLVGHFLEKMGRHEPVKRLDASAMAKLKQHDWPGNVRELEHVLERAAILTGDTASISGREIEFSLAIN